jgi:predicted patatin/cPLA2 family phospholipase
MELIISSGGNKGVALIGALNEFIKYYPIHNIKFYTGCSIGALISLAINLGYTIEELNDILFKINFGSFQELKLINLIEKCGFDDGIKFSNFIKAIIINKNYSQDITFKELYEKTNKILTLVVTNITKGIPEYHNYINTPNLSILLSIRMSINIPLLFAPILYHNNYYVDGALLEPFPYFCNKNVKISQKYGLWLFEKYEINFIKNNNGSFINELGDSFQYMIKILKIIHINYIKKYYKKIPKDVIYIDFDIKNLDFNKFELTLEERIKMFNIGMNKCKLFFIKKYKKNRKRYLSIKYFRLWRKNLRFPHISL